jgi:hypothetical protein
MGIIIHKVYNTNPFSGNEKYDYMPFHIHCQIAILSWQSFPEVLY